jgi:hypothetical protein
MRGASNPEFTSPSLQVVVAYSLDAFTQLLRTGVALGGRQLPVMSPRARENLSHLTDAEITALATRASTKAAIAIFFIPAVESDRIGSPWCRDLGHTR